MRSATCSFFLAFSAVVGFKRYALWVGGLPCLAVKTVFGVQRKAADACPQCTSQWQLGPRPCRFAASSALCASKNDPHACCCHQSLPWKLWALALFSKSLHSGCRAHLSSRSRMERLQAVVGRMSTDEKTHIQTMHGLPRRRRPLTLVSLPPLRESERPRQPRSLHW